MFNLKEKLQQKREEAENGQTKLTTAPQGEPKPDGGKSMNVAQVAAWIAETITNPQSRIWAEGSTLHSIHFEKVGHQEVLVHQSVCFSNIKIVRRVLLK